MHREKKRLLRRQLREMANLKRNGSGNSHGGSSNGMGSLNGSTGARANYHSDTSGRTRGIVEVITLTCSDTEEEEEVRFVGKKRRGEY